MLRLEARTELNGHLAGTCCLKAALLSESTGRGGGEKNASLRPFKREALWCRRGTRCVSRCLLSSREMASGASRAMQAALLLALARNKQRLKRRWSWRQTHPLRRLFGVQAAHRPVVALVDVYQPASLFLVQLDGSSAAEFVFLAKTQQKKKLRTMQL